MKMTKVKTLNYKYSLKRILPMVAMAGAGLMAACNDKPVDDPYAEPIDPVKVLAFGNYFGSDSIQYENVMKYANDPRITKIIYFLDSVNDNNSYTGYNSTNVTKRREWLQERLNYTTKATGSGTFIFGPNAASTEDSLWFVANGWKIRTR